MPCWMVRTVDIDVSQAAWQEGMEAAFMKVLGMDLETFKYWYYNQKKKIVRIPEGSPAAQPETLAKIKREYSKLTVARAARAKGYKIRQISENRWEVHR